MKQAKGFKLLTTTYNDLSRLFDYENEKSNKKSYFSKTEKLKLAAPIARLIRTQQSCCQHLLPQILGTPNQPPIRHKRYTRPLYNIKKKS